MTIRNKPSKIRDWLVEEGCFSRVKQWKNFCDAVPGG
jgi:hypothetical protein